MDKLADVLKVFIEKHLIPTVISVAGAIMLLLYLPSDYWIINKIGNTLFLIIAFCCIFLIVQLLIGIGNSIKHLAEKSATDRYYNSQRTQSDKEAIQAWNDYIDGLLPLDKDILLTFMRNENKILIKSEVHCYDYTGLFNNDKIINKSIFPSGIKGIVGINEEKYWIDFSLKDSLRGGFRPAGNLYQYKIKDDVYKSLKSIYDLQEGRLGNF